MTDKHQSHETRFSMGASSWDGICVFCGRTDIAGGGWGLLAKPCPATEQQRNERRWK